MSLNAFLLAQEGHLDSFTKVLLCQRCACPCRSISMFYLQSVEANIPNGLIPALL